ncbi:TIMELESS [Bugula neritina]|uniref:TIMELESS n=1 Tax=Bugula neritina TaxID=10212 RepID=A0A7J7KF84_BUGNE|nr:TIMELESS [Bugula neritina]
MTQTGKLIYTELQSIANGIGKFHNGDYIREQDAVDCVKDLIKSLRRENETCNIRRFLGQAQVLQEDLVPLIVYYGRADEELFEVTIRCLMNLTQPARIVFKNEVPQDQSTRHCYIQVEEYLQEYKQAFVNEQFLKVLSEKLAYFLELSWEERSEDQNVLIERLLVLLRNILHVAATDVDRLRTDDDASTHDQIVWQMHQAVWTNLSSTSPRQMMRGGLLSMCWRSFLSCLEIRRLNSCRLPVLLAVVERKRETSRSWPG